MENSVNKWEPKSQKWIDWLDSDTKTITDTGTYQVFTGEYKTYREGQSPPDLGSNMYTDRKSNTYWKCIEVKRFNFEESSSLKNDWIKYDWEAVYKEAVKHWK